MRKYEVVNRRSKKFRERKRPRGAVTLLAPQGRGLAWFDIVRVGEVGQVGNVWKVLRVCRCVGGGGGERRGKREEGKPGGGGGGALASVSRYNKTQY